jgi:hypothetical protein
MIIFPTPEHFLTKTNHTYPPGNTKVFEQFFYESSMLDTRELDRIYLPIQWTSFYFSKNYATQNMDDIQCFLDQLPRDKKYFTIVQWDDGIVNRLDGLDILIFSSGGVGHYPIPLINCPYQREERERNIFASFVGVVRGRHKIREKLLETLGQNPDYCISEPREFNDFKEIMERSIFSLCPRGYGKTSFRINEALNLGSIPVYIYDEPWIPFPDEINFNEYGVLIGEKDVTNIDHILKKYTTEDIGNLQKKGQKAYTEYFLYESCYDKIIRKLKK